MKLISIILVTIFVTMINAKSLPDFSEIQPLNFEDIELLESERSEIVDKILTGFTNFVQKNVHFLDAQLENIVKKIVSQLFLLADFTVEGVSRHVRNTKAKLVMSNTESGKKCNEKYGYKLETEMQKGRNVVESCVVKGVDEVTHIRKSVQIYIDAIETETLRFVEVLKECIHPLNPFSTTKCLWNNLKNVYASVKIIISNANDALKNSSKQFVGVVSHARVCLRQGINETEINVNGIIAEAEECLKQSEASTEPEPEPSYPENHKPSYPENHKPSEEEPSCPENHKPSGEKPSYPENHKPSGEKPYYPEFHKPSGEKPSYPENHKPSTNGRPSRPENLAELEGF